MHITRYTDYALRVLMYVALKDQQRTTIREIAASYDISRNHLMKVVQELNNKGYLNAIRGKNGGVRLAGKPENINIGQLMRDMEQDLPLVECFNDQKHSSCGCAITPACQLKLALADALESFFSALDQYTLADMLPNKKARQLVQLLQIK